MKMIPWRDWRKSWQVWRRRRKLGKGRKLREGRKEGKGRKEEKETAEERIERDPPPPGSDRSDAGALPDPGNHPRLLPPPPQGENHSAEAVPGNPVEDNEARKKEKRKKKKVGFVLCFFFHYYLLFNRLIKAISEIKFVCGRKMGDGR